MVISRTPFRISLAGGGSDLKSFYKESPGAVISSSIDKYIYLSMHTNFEPAGYLLKYSNTENVMSIDDIQHDLIREVFRYFDIQNVNFNSTADIPAGTGMGSSSAFTCGLVNLCGRRSGLSLPSYEIAKIACKIEIDILGEPIGKQDQYGCGYGGLKFIQFNPDESVEIKPILLPYSKLVDLEDNLLLFYTANTRKASSILTEQKSNTINRSEVKDDLKAMVTLAERLFNDLNNGDIESVGHYLNEGWQRKKKLASKISNSVINDMYELAMNNGAIGGKLLGAGGGGFLLLYVPGEKQEQFRNAFCNYRELPFKFEFEGTKIIFEQ